MLNTAERKLVDSITVSEANRETGHDGKEGWFALGKLQFVKTPEICPESMVDTEKVTLVSDKFGENIRLGLGGYFINAYIVSTTEKLEEGDSYYNTTNGKIEVMKGFYLNDPNSLRLYHKVLLHDEDLLLGHIKAIGSGKMKEHDPVLIMCRKIVGNGESFIVKRPYPVLISANVAKPNKYNNTVIIAPKAVAEEPRPRLKVEHQEEPQFPAKKKLKVSMQLTLSKENLVEIIQKRDEYISLLILGKTEAEEVNQWLDGILE